MPTWTQAQKTAIETRGTDVLVSAAAGSGKTASLTERIIGSILGGTPLERILIVTFSRAAASDMRAKLTRELRKRAAEATENKAINRARCTDDIEIGENKAINRARCTDDIEIGENKAINRARCTDDTEIGENKAINRALAALPNANIGTIHSFCLSLLKRNYGELSLPAKLRVADDSEAKLMKSECMDDTLDHFFSEKSPAAEGDARKRDPATDFVELVDQLLGGQTDDALASTLLSLYDKTSCLPERYRTLIASAEEMKKSAEDGKFLLSDCGGAVRRYIDRGLEFYGAVFSAAVRELSVIPELNRKYSPAFEYLEAYVRRAGKILVSGDFDALGKHFSELSPPRLGVVRDGKTPRTEYFKAKKTEFTAFVKSVRERYLALGGQGLSKTLSRTASVTLGIVRVLDEFDRRYAEEKRRRGLLDYEDLEHFALALLRSPERASVIKADYDEIYIDEYQDVNAVQNEIFSAIAEKNRFMVGDVKQSIYAFRGADPTLFDSLRKSYEKITDVPSEPPTGGAAVYMSDNFRCDTPVVGFTNAVCGRIMPHGNVSYTDDDALRRSKLAEEPIYTPVSILVAESGELSDAPNAESGLEAADAEPEMLARELERLLREEKRQSGERIRPRDVAILLRSAAAGRAERIERALERHGIPVANGTKQSFFECPEVLFVLCLLNTVDNPLRDIYLAGALRSPAFGFSLDELIRIRGDEKGPLYRRLCAVASDADASPELVSKCREAADRIASWRERAKMSTAAEIIAMIYEETGIEALVFSDANRENGAAPPEVRAENLSLLYDYARNYEASAFRGLHKFLDFVGSLIERGVTASIGDASSGGEDAVRIMTVHQSKGLEFPVTCLAYTGAPRNEQDLRAGVIYEKTAGLAMPLRAEPSEDGLESSVMLETLPHRAVAAATSELLAAEEMRILYVALTRAEERLIITGKLKNAVEKLENMRADADFYGAHTVYSERTYLGWMLSAIFAEEKLGNTVHAQIRIVSPDESEINVDLPTEKKNATEGCDAKKEPDRAEVERLKAIIREELAYRYPYARLGELPAKLSVSVLSPDVLDPDTDGTLLAAEHTSADSSAAEEAAAAGTATHTFMQFCDFAQAETDARAEAERLIAEGFMRKSDADLIRYGELEVFFRSEIYQKMKNADEIRREMRFNVRLSAADFASAQEDRELYANEKLLVQGVIDCFFRDADGITLVDYKTDRLSAYELSHPSVAAQKLLDRHARQLGYYACALGEMYGEKPHRVYIYSLPLGDVIEVK